MDRIKKLHDIAISVASLLLLLAVLFFSDRYTDLANYYQYSEKYIMGIELVSAEEIAKMTDTSVLKKLNKNETIKYDDILIPFDQETDTLYVSQTMNREGWEGYITAENAKLYLLKSEYGQDKLGAIQSGEAFQLYAVADGAYYELKLVVSGMPLINIQIEDVQMPKELVYEEDPDEYVFGNETEYYGDITVFDPDMEDASDYSIFQSGIHFHEKGALSAAFAKKGYSLHLTDEKGAQEKHSLLGMRNDDDWKLNALYSDQNKIREKTASELWKSIDAVSPADEAGPAMEYVELILNGEYKGLYVLVEPVDAKQTKLDGNDVLYKIVNWDVPEDASIQESIDQGYRVQYPVRLRYPKKVTDYHAAWSPLRDYLNVFYREVDRPYNEMIQNVDVRNIVDFNIFLMSTSAVDNAFKNTILAAHVSGDGQYSMIIHPWDLDYTFGNYCYGTDVVTATAFDETETVTMLDESMEELTEADQSAMKEQFMPVWKNYRESFLATKSIGDLMQQYEDYIVNTGAMARDSEKWPECENSSEIEYLKEYIDKRMNWLEKYWESYFAE